MEVLLAGDAVQKYGPTLIGREVLTVPFGAWPGGMAKVIELAPDPEAAPEIVMQVRGLSVMVDMAVNRGDLDSNEIGVGITECELRYEGCWRDNALSTQGGAIDRGRDIARNQQTGKHQLHTGTRRAGRSGRRRRLAGRGFLPALCWRPARDAGVDRRRAGDLRVRRLMWWC